jgi:ComF family protein
VRLLRALVDLLLPAVCALCGAGAPGGPLCPACARGVPEPPPAGRAPPPLAAWAAGAPFDGPWAEWLRRFKYPAPGLAGLDPAADAVAEALALRAAARAPGPAPELVVPVPLHPARLAARGFNPAALLAAALARALGLRCAPAALRRVRDTPSQTGLSRAARRRNVRGAFAAARPLPARVWIVDDVATTGATLAAAARAARRAGAREILGLTAARTPR